MRCGKCGHKQKNTFKRCGHCGHAAVANPKSDGVGDPGLKKATQKLCHDNTLFFLPAHLSYEILRIVNRKSSGLGRKWKFSLTFMLVSLTFWLTESLIIGLVIAAIGSFLSLLKAARPKDVFALAEHYFAVNPHPNLVPETPPQDPLKVAFKALLICEQRSFANFLLMNQWHLHNACAVIGPENSGDTHFPNIASVFILHNLTPNGLSFAQQRQSVWSSERPEVSFIDLGLGAFSRIRYGCVMVP